MNQLYVLCDRVMLNVNNDLAYDLDPDALQQQQRVIFQRVGGCLC